MVNIGNEWDSLLKEEFEKEYYTELRKFLVHEYNHYVIYPNMYDIFNALRYTSYSNVKVVLLGQDPYHGENQAHGLCFSVKKGVAQPPSLKNIFKELKDDLGCEIPNHGELTKWANEGVLLLNTSLTVREHLANSHSKKGWEIFTDNVIKLLNEQDRPIVFILWGRNAISKTKYLNNPKHLILTSVHPSPLSAYGGFFGSKPFSKTNKFLLENNIVPIKWTK